jgi:CRP-like cAMP-binding protein
MLGESSEREVVAQRSGSAIRIRDCQVEKRVAVVQLCPLFADVPEIERREILAAAHEKQYSRRQTIFLEGDPVRQTILLTSGCAKIVQIGQSGSEVILRLIGTGDLVGGVGVSPQGRNCSMAQSINSSTALVWDVATFESLSHRFKTLRRNAINILNNRLQDLEVRYREISTERVAARLGHQLLRLLGQVGQPVNGAIEIGLSREELAQLTGTTLFTVSRLLSDWDQRGIVSTRREAVSINDHAALAELSEAE